MHVGVVLRQKMLLDLLSVVFCVFVTIQCFGFASLSQGILLGFQQDASQPRQAKIQADVAELPLSFIANAGQVDANVQFMVKAGKHTIFFTPQAVVFAASEQTKDELTRSSAASPGDRLFVRDVGNE